MSRSFRMIAVVMLLAAPARADENALVRRTTADLLAFHVKDRDFRPVEVAPWVYRQLTETFMLDPEMRERLASLNPVASAKVANRLIEAHERKYWSPDPEMLDVLRRAGEELEDRLEGVGVAA